MDPEEKFSLPVRKSSLRQNVVFTRGLVLAGQTLGFSSPVRMSLRGGGAKTGTQGYLRKPSLVTFSRMSLRQTRTYQRPQIHTWGG